MGYIEKVHENNFKLIKENDLKVGTILVKDNLIEEITHIHNMYGWILTKSLNNDICKVPQEVSKIFEQNWTIKESL